MAIYKEDIVDIELESGTIHRSWLNRSIGLGDVKANRFGVRMFRNGAAENIEGSTCIGFFMRPDGTNLQIQGSTYTGISGNKAWVALPQDCYAYEGRFTLAIKVISSGAGITGTMRIVDGMVDNTGTTGTVSPTSTVPTSAEIIAAYEEAVAVIDGSVRHDIVQSLTDAQKAQARTNISAASQAALDAEAETREYEDEKQDRAMLHEFVRQCIDPDSATSGKYYWHGDNGTSDNEHTYIIEPIRVYQGTGYTFVNVYGYFCTIIYDDGTKVPLTDSTLTRITVNVPALAKSGWAYVTVYETNIDTAMVVAGDSNFDGMYIEGYSPDPQEFRAADLILKNKLIAVSNSGNVSTWVTQDYTIDGNEITYTAPASGNSGFYITPEKKGTVSKVRVKLDVASNGGGTMAVHVWDTVTSSFADHLLTIGTFNASRVYEIDLEAVAEQRPQMAIDSWVILVSNIGSGFTFVFNSISVLADSGVPEEIDGMTIGEVLGDLYGQGIPLNVECGPGKQYTRLRDAIAAAETARGSTVTVYPGTYDLTSEFAAEIAAATGSNMGIELTNDVYVKFLSGSYVKALFPVSSVDISDHFQPFYSAGSGFTLDGLNIEASNCRYCVHDERGGADVKYHNVYKNCRMKFTMDNPAQSGGTSKYMQCIGGGLGKYGYIEIDGGHYTTVNNLSPDSQQPISYHNGVSDGCDSKIFIKDAYLANKGIIRMGCYGTSTIKSPVYVCGCRMYDHVYKMYEVPQTYHVDNFDVVEWNNEIES